MALTSGDTKDILTKLKAAFDGLEWYQTVHPRKFIPLLSFSCSSHLLSHLQLLHLVLKSFLNEPESLLFLVL